MQCYADISYYCTRVSAQNLIQNSRTFSGQFKDNKFKFLTTVCLSFNFRWKMRICSFKKENLQKKLQLLSLKKGKNWSLKSENEKMKKDWGKYEKSKKSF